MLYPFKRKKCRRGKDCDARTRPLIVVRVDPARGGEYPKLSVSSPRVGPARNGSEGRNSTLTNRSKSTVRAWAVNPLSFRVKGTEKEHKNRKGRNDRFSHRDLRGDCPTCSSLHSEGRGWRNSAT